MLSAYSVFFPSCQRCFCLCSGFVEVLLMLAVPLVAAKRRTGRGTRRMLLWFCFLYFLLLPPAFSCASFTPLPLFLSQIFFPFPVLLSSYVHAFPFFFSFLSLCGFPFLPCFFSAPAPPPPPVQSSSPAFIGQREPCAGNGRLVLCM